MRQPFVYCFHTSEASGLSDHEIMKLDRPAVAGECLDQAATSVVLSYWSPP